MSDHPERRQILSLIKGGTLGIISGLAIETPFNILSNFLSEKYIDPIADRHASRIAMVKCFGNLLSTERIKCSVGTILKDFHFEEPFDTHALRSFGQDDIAASRAILDAIGIKAKDIDDLTDFHHRLNYAPADLLATGGRFTNPDIAAIFDNQRGHILHLPLARRSVELPYIFEKVTHLKPIRRVLSGIPISEKHIGLRSVGRNTLCSDLDDDGHPKNGYLMVTKFPHPRWSGKKVLHIGGNTGPATEAAELLFTGEFIKKGVAEDFDDLMQNSEGCQALFFCSRLKSDTAKGRHKFTKIELYETPRRLKVIGT